jgi:hypothetical protein
MTPLFLPVCREQALDKLHKFEKRTLPFELRHDWFLGGHLPYGTKALYPREGSTRVDSALHIRQCGWQLVILTNTMAFISHV